MIKLDTPSDVSQFDVMHIKLTNKMLSVPDLNESDDNALRDQFMRGYNNKMDDINKEKDNVEEDVNKMSAFMDNHNTVLADTKLDEEEKDENKNDANIFADSMKDNIGKMKVQEMLDANAATRKKNPTLKKNTKIVKQKLIASPQIPKSETFFTKIMDNKLLLGGSVIFMVVVLFVAYIVAKWAFRISNRSPTKKKAKTKKDSVKKKK